MNKLLAKLTPVAGSKTAVLLGWAVCAAVAALHSWTLNVAPYQASTVIWVFPLLVLVPGLVSTLVLPAEWKHWYRWMAVLGLTYSSYAEFIAPIMLIGTTWALHRAWITERTAPLRSLLTLRRKTAESKNPAPTTA